LQTGRRYRARADIFGQQRRIALEAAAGEHHLAPEARAALFRPVRIQAADMPVVVQQQPPRRGVIEELDAQGLGARRQRLDQRGAAADRQQPGLGLGQELRGQEVEAHAEFLQPGNGARHVFGELADDLGVGRCQHAGHVRPGLAPPGHFRRQVGIDVRAGILGQVGLEVVRHLGQGLHAQIGLGVAALAAPVLARGAFQHRHLQAALGPRYRGRQAGDATTRHHQIEISVHDSAL
jgi:hypothetical protein